MGLKEYMVDNISDTLRFSKLISCPSSIAKGQSFCHLWLRLLLWPKKSSSVELCTQVNVKNSIVEMSGRHKLRLVTCSAKQKRTFQNYDHLDAITWPHPTRHPISTKRHKTCCKYSYSSRVIISRKCKIDF